MLFFSFQNTTSKRYHLSGLSLSAAWPDMESESLLSYRHSHERQEEFGLFSGLFYTDMSTANLLVPLYLPPAPMSASNSTLTYLPGTLGMSYMCSAEQVLEVTTALSLNTFKLQVQPFGLSGDQFATGEKNGSAP